MFVHASPEAIHPRLLQRRRNCVKRPLFPRARSVLYYPFPFYLSPRISYEANSSISAQVRGYWKREQEQFSRVPLPPALPLRCRIKGKRVIFVENPAENAG